MQPGQCTLPPDESGRILDRLAGLEQVIPPEAVRQALESTGRINPRRCQLTHEVVCWVVLAMGILTELPIRQVFKHARRLRVGEETRHRSSLCVARQMSMDPNPYEVTEPELLRGPRLSWRGSLLPDLPVSRWFSP